jgi:hypothetical protein
MVTHRWWADKFCKKTCKAAYLRELALDRDTIRRWFGFPHGIDLSQRFIDKPVRSSIGHKGCPKF